MFFYFFYLMTLFYVTSNKKQQGHDYLRGHGRPGGTEELNEISLSE
jgi:hypothetical protein